MTRAPLFRLTVALCCDLQRDFYEQGHFWPFFDTIIDLVTPSGSKKGNDANPELLENVFSTLAHLLKLCWAPMSKRLSEVYDRFRPLLSHRRSYLRRFSSEALSFLVRKTNNFNDFLLHCLNDDDENLAELLFEAMRATSTSFHSRAGEMLETTLALLEHSDDKIVRNAFDLSTSLHPILAKHAIGEMAKPLLVDVLLKRTVAVFHRLKTCVDGEKPKTIGLLEKHLRLLSIWRTNSKGKAFFDLCLPSLVQELLIPVISEVYDNGSDSQEFYSAFLELAATVFGYRGVVDGYRKEFEKFTKRLFDSALDQSISVAMRTSYVTSLAESSSDGCGVAFELVCLPTFGDFVERILTETEAEAASPDGTLDDIVACYCRILAIKRPEHDSEIQRDVYDLYPGRKFVVFRRLLAKRLSNAGRTDAVGDNTKLACSIAIFGSLIAKDGGQQGRKVLEGFLAKWIDSFVSSGSLVLYATLRSLNQDSSVTTAIRGLVKILRPRKWLEIFECDASNEDLTWILRAAVLYFEAIGHTGMLNDIDEALFAKVVEKLSDHFMSSSHSVRLSNARLLSRLQVSLSCFQAIPKS